MLIQCPACSKRTCLLLVLSAWKWILCAFQNTEHSFIKNNSIKSLHTLLTVYCILHAMYPATKTTSSLQGPCRRWGWGLQSPHFFGRLSQFLFLPFTKRVYCTILCQISGPLRKCCLFVICLFWSNSFFWGFCRTNKARWSSVLLGLVLKAWKMIHF